jgi:hypothetical protein
VKENGNPAMFGPVFKAVPKNWITSNAGLLKELIFRRTSHSILNVENATII